MGVNGKMPARESSSIRIGIDLGGTKIEAIALGKEGETLVRRRVGTPRGDYDATIEAIIDMVSGIEEETSRGATVGIGIPGAIAPGQGVVKNANSVWLNGQPLLEDLQGRLSRPVRLENDANCFALSEAVDGAGAGASVVFGVIVGTGTGGGIVVEGRCLTGPNAIAGEWGHNPLPWPGPEELPGPECYCGMNGCIETFLSGPGMARDHRTVAGEDLSSVEIVDRAISGDEAARATIRRYEERMARSLAGIINVLDPDVIVLGGGLSNLESLYTNVPRLWEVFVFSDSVHTRLLPPVHGDSSGVRGAAWLW
jgi:fructokinase